MAADNAATFGYHETRLARLDEEVADLGAQLAERRAEHRAVLDKLDTVADKLDRIDAKLDTQDDRIARLETCAQASKRRGAFWRKHWSHALLAGLGAAGSVLGKFAVAWLLHK